MSRKDKNLALYSVSQFLLLVIDLLGEKNPEATLDCPNFRESIYFGKFLIPA